MPSGKMTKMHQRVLDKNRVKIKEPGLPEPTNNTFWDDAKQHYVNSIGAIEKVEGTLRDTLVDFLDNKEKLDLIKDPTSLANNINILTKDITEHTVRLNEIYEKHANRSGGTVTPDEHMELLHIHGEYADALEIYQANIIPTVAYILEQIGVVEELILASSPQTDPRTDVNVVTDVEIKETTVVQ